MSCAGCDWVATPNLDRLARQGTRFTSAYVAYPVCVASRASIMTGRLPHQCNPDPTGWADSLGRVMTAAGYETAYFGKWHVGNTKLDKVREWHRFETAFDFGGMDADAAAKRPRGRRFGCCMCPIADATKGRFDTSWRHDYMVKEGQTRGRIPLKYPVICSVGAGWAEAFAAGRGGEAAADALPELTG